MIKDKGIGVGLASILGIIAIIVSIVGSGMIYNDDDKFDALEKQIADLKVVEEVAPVEAVEVIEETSTQDLIYEKLMEDDVWEIAAETIALEEIEDGNYEELAEWLIGKTLPLDDEDDIEKVVIKEVTIKNSGYDVDDKDAKVKVEMKVYYEDQSGDTIKVYVTAEATIKDSEVEELTFEYTYIVI